MVLAWAKSGLMMSSKRSSPVDLMLLEKVSLSVGLFSADWDVQEPMEAGEALQYRSGAIPGLFAAVLSREGHKLSRSDP